MAFCKTIKSKYDPVIKVVSGGFEGFFFLKGKAIRRRTARQTLTIREAEADLNKWLVTYYEDRKSGVL